MSALLSISKISRGRYCRSGAARPMPHRNTKIIADGVQALASDCEGAFTISARNADGRVIQELVVKAPEARTLVKNAKAERREFEKRSGSVLRRVLMRPSQSRFADPKVGKRPPDKGLNEKTDRMARPLVSVSNLIDQRIKAEILKSHENKSAAARGVDQSGGASRPKSSRPTKTPSTRSSSSLSISKPQAAGPMSPASSTSMSSSTSATKNDRQP